MLRQAEFAKKVDEEQDKGCQADNEIQNVSNLKTGKGLTVWMRFIWGGGNKRKHKYCSKYCGFSQKRNMDSEVTVENRWGRESGGFRMSLGSEHSVLLFPSIDVIKPEE